MEGTCRVLLPNTKGSRYGYPYPWRQPIECGQRDCLFVGTGTRLQVAAIGLGCLEARTFSRRPAASQQSSIGFHTEEN